MQHKRSRIGAAALVIVTGLAAVAVGAGSGSGTAAAATVAKGAASYDPNAVLKMPLPTPQILDPVRAVNACDVNILSPIYDTLIRTDPKGKYIPGIAASWSAPDASTFVLKLRPNVKFSDGTALDAEAVKASITRGQTDPSSVVKTALSPISAVTVVDPTTVKLTLSKPVVGLMTSLFAGRAGMIVSPTAVTAAGTAFGTTAANAVGAGPYKMTTFQSQGDYASTAWKGYWDSKNRKLAGLKLTNTQGATAGYGPFITRLAQGEFDALSMKEADIAVARAQPNLVVKTGPSELMMQLMINYNKAPFDNKAVRQALEYAVDRPALVAAIAQNLGVPADGPLPPTSWAYNPALKGMYKYNPTKAKALLKKAGLDSVSFTASVPNTSLYVQLATAVQDMLKKSNINMTIRQVAGQDINTELYVKKTDPAGVTGWSEAADPGDFFNVKYASNGSNNAAVTAIPGLDDLLAQGAATTDQAKRAVAYKKAQKLIMDQAIEVPLYFAPAVTVASKKVQGIPKAYSTCVDANFVTPSISMKK
ncbi:MAG: extracellular solute-binding protein family 5 [Actinomycetia bacterium]|nr:extracellular solute-binding protein family 5 [Actinomycetes bacterium]